MLTSHNIETQISIRNYDKNGRLRDLIEMPSSKNSVSGEIECVIKNSDGTTDSVHKYPMRSFVKNFFAFLSSGLAGGTAPRTVTTDGQARADYEFSGHTIEVTATYGMSTYGVMIGTGGATAVTPTQYALVTQIAHGTGAGQMEYFPTQTTGVVADSSDYSTYAHRTFVNSSSGSITVSEVGLYFKIYGQSLYYMLARDTIDYAGSPISLAVGVGQTLTVFYKFKVFESSGLTKNFANSLHYMYIEPTQTSYQDTSNVSRTSGNVASNGLVIGVSATTLDTYGIVVGTGSSAMNIDGYVLDSKISTGVAAGNLYYNQPYITVPITTATYNVVKFGRSFTNFTADSVTFDEFAWYGYGNTFARRTMLGRWLTGGITLSEFETSQINISIIGYA